MIAMRTKLRTAYGIEVGGAGGLQHGGGWRRKLTTQRWVAQVAYSIEVAGAGGVEHCGALRRWRRASR